MAKVELPYINHYTDRHGQPRFYVRRKGQPQVPLPGLPGSAEFMAAYAAAIAGVAAEPRQIGVKRTIPGSLSALLADYYRSHDFTTLAASTQAQRRNVFERLREKHGDKPVKRLEPNHIRRWLDAKAATPEAANHLRKALRQLMAFAKERGYRRDNPMVDIRPLRTRKTGGHRTWTDEEIAAFEAHWAPETRERLAFALLLYTAVRISDVVTLGRQHERSGKLNVLPIKTSATSGARVALPIHPALRQVLDAHPRDRMTFLQTAYGRPFTAAGLGNWFRDARRATGLPEGLSAHGLRKAVGRRLAEAGCTAHEIMSVLTHTTLEEAERYTREANRDLMAAAAMERLGAPAAQAGNT